MTEFTGDYNRCMQCSHIYDYNDICPECSSDDIETLNAIEVEFCITEYQVSERQTRKESERLIEMMKSHGD